MPPASPRPLAFTVLAGLALAVLLAGCQRETPDERAAAPATQPAPAATPDMPPEPSEPPVVADVRQTYQCGEMRIEARFSPQGVLLDISGRELHLPQTISASGARYGEGDPEFWTRSVGEARLTLNGETFDCTALDADARSPWAEARERDVGFRAVGSEPGWHVEVDMGEAPQMRLALDYGQRQLTVERSEPFTGDNGVTGYRGEVDGEAVELTIRREDCADPMSGEAFEASATLDFEGDTYRACGRFLWD